MWLLIAEQWAKALGTTGDQLELIMFTDALPAGSRWRPVPGAERAARVTPGRRASAATRPAGTARVVLLGCVKLKLAHPSPARDLYVSLRKPPVGRG